MDKTKVNNAIYFRGFSNTDVNNIFRGLEILKRKNVLNFYLLKY